MRARRLRIALGPLAVLAAVGAVACGEETISLPETCKETAQAAPIRVKVLAVRPVQLVGDAPLGPTRLSVAEAAAQQVVPIPRLRSWFK